jgi:cyclophilin family peptidyl-prolyl cis-trans isomerase
MRNISRRLVAVSALAVCLLAAPVVRAQAPAATEDASQLEALIHTSKGDITIRFFAKDAPLHVAHFIETARKGGFDGTTFFRAIGYAIIQGGDPISKDPKKKAQYGTGGLKLLPDEISSHKHYAGAVSAVMIPGPDGNPTPGSSGTQFFVCDTYQQALDGKYSIFGWVTDGMDVVRAISLLPATNGVINERVEIQKVTIRPATPTVEELANLRARIETDAGEIVWEFLPTAPDNARNFIRLARAGYYDGTTIYRALAGQLIQGASQEGWPADSPNKKRSFSLWSVPDEFSTTVQMDRGTVGMAHGDQPNSATVHFFVLVARSAYLDGKYTPFAHVVSGIEVVDAISNQPAPNQTLTTPVRIKKVTIEPKK